MSEITYSVAEAVALLPEYKIVGNASCTFNNVRTIQEANGDSIVWISPSKTNKQLLLDQTVAGIIICDESLDLSRAIKEGKCCIVVDNPRLSYLRIVAALFEPRPEPFIHSTAVIHPEARIGNNAYIGPHAVIGKSWIGDNALIYGNCFIYDKVKIGDNVVVNAGVVIGASGFGYSKNEKGALERFPHIGGVIIGNNVEIGANSCIDRGALGDTILDDDVKLDNFVHVAHNVKIGKRCLLTAACMIAGSATIGDDVWLGPNSSISSGVTIGNGGYITIGSVVTKNVLEQEKVTGNFAIPHDKFLRNLKHSLG